MAFLSETFDVNELPKGNSNFEPLPAGWYTSTITQAELKTTTSGNGEYIKLRYDITGPSHQGRVVFGNLNIKNPTVKTEEIGRQQLGDIMRAIGLAKVVDTDNLIGKQIGIKVSIKDDPKYGLGNEVKGFKSVSGSTVPAVGVMPVKAAAPAPAKAAPPWVKK